MDDKYLNIKNISKSYTDRVGFKINLLENISFNIDSKEFTTILAPIGSGKTSLLKILAGLLKPTSGDINTSISKKTFIPSLPSSFPWLNVKDNILFNTTLGKDKIEEIIDIVGLRGYEEHFPHNKSEGFRFRISLGRALAYEPEIIILDEPFNNLNSETRKEIYLLVRSVYERYEIPFLLGTTNITEAIYLSDKIHLMKKNPGQIFDSIENLLGKERKLDLIESSNFISKRTKIETIFKEKAERMLYNFSI